jgi:hypothetical protein
MLSPEILVLIQAIKSELMNKKNSKVYPVDFKVLQNKLWFHSIRPVLYQFFNESDNYNPPGSIKEELAIYTRTQTFISLKYTYEVNRLLQIFREKGLKAIPYKGVLFLQELYKNTQLRELGDMDFLFHPDSAAEGIRILLAESYKFNTVDKSFEKLPDNELIKIAINASGQYEISLVNNDLHIDFHWGLHYSFLPFNIDFNSFFNEEKPNPETLFWMLLLHHGGKENWVRMKHFADLIAFLNHFQDQLNWNEIIQTAKIYKLHKQLVVGFRLLKKHFNYSIPKSIEIELIDYYETQKVEHLIENCWNKSAHWSTLIPRLQMERIFINIQDEGFSKRKYFGDFYQSYTKPNPLEQPRILNFPASYPKLNFISKVLTYLIRKFR